MLYPKKDLSLPKRAILSTYIVFMSLTIDSAESLLSGKFSMDFQGSWSEGQP